MALNPPLIHLLDPNSLAWRLGVSNGGISSITSTTTPTTTPVSGVFLKDVISGANWQLIVAIVQTLPDLKNIPTTTVSLQTQILLQSPNGNLWGLQIVNGIQQVVPATCVSGLIGTLYIANYNNVPWTQPSGPGTTVFPQERNSVWTEYPVPGQLFSESSGLWTVGCGHWVDYPAVFRDIDPCTGKTAAIIACPICSYIQYLIQPYEAFYDPISNAITII